MAPSIPEAGRRHNCDRVYPISQLSLRDWIEILLEPGRTDNRAEALAADADAVIQAHRLNVFDFVSKSEDPRHLLRSVERIALTHPLAKP